MLSIAATCHTYKNKVKLIVQQGMSSSFVGAFIAAQQRGSYRYLKIEDST